MYLLKFSTFKKILDEKKFKKVKNRIFNQHFKIQKKNLKLQTIKTTKIYVFNKNFQRLEKFWMKKCLKKVKNRIFNQHFSFLFFCKKMCKINFLFVKQICAKKLLIRFKFCNSANYFSSFLNMLFWSLIFF